ADDAVHEHDAGGTAAVEQRADDGRAGAVVDLEGIDRANGDSHLKPKLDSAGEDVVRGLRWLSPSEAVFLPSPQHALDDVGAHLDLVGPGAREAFRRPLPRRVDPHLAA